MNGEPDGGEQVIEYPPRAFVTCVVTLEPGRVLSYDEAAWRDAIVFVTDGEIELQCTGGASRRFRCGHVLWLANLPLKTLSNPGQLPARLVAISRRV